jgi:multidrug resistance efflux pump
MEAHREDARNQELGDLVPMEARQQENVKVTQVEAAVAQAHAGVSQANANLTQAQAALAQAQAALLLAQSEVGIAQLNLKRTSVLAAVDGVAADVQLRPGTYLNAGHPAFGVVDSASLHVDGYFEETKLGNVQRGDAATITIMGDKRTLQGHVESVAPGISDRERTPSGDLLANINPTFNWVRLAQRIPVRIHIDHAPDNLLLVAGRTATVVLYPGSAKKSVWQESDLALNEDRHR